VSFIIYRSVHIDTASGMTCTSSSPYKPALVIAKVFQGRTSSAALIFARTSGILIHPAVCPQQIWAENCGGAVPLLGRGAGSPTQCGLGWGLPPCQVSSWSISLFGHNTPMLQTDRQTTVR